MQLNGDEENLSLTNFNVGTMVQIPDMLADEIHAIAELDRALRRPDIRVYLKDDGLSLPD